MSRPSRLFRPCSHSPPGRLFRFGYGMGWAREPGIAPELVPPSAGGDPRTPREPGRAGTAPSAHRAGAHPTHPPRTTQHRPRASATGAARNEPPAIGQTLHSAISAYRAVRALIGPGRRGRRGLPAGRCRAPEPRPLVPRLGRARRVVGARGAEVRAGRAVVTLVTVREGCWRPGGPASSSPSPDGRSPETAIHPRGRQVAVGQVPGRDFGACPGEVSRESCAAPLQPGFGTPGPGLLLVGEGCRAVSLRGGFPSTLILLRQLLPAEPLRLLTIDHLQPEERTSKCSTATLVPPPLPNSEIERERETRLSAGRMI